MNAPTQAITSTDIEPQQTPAEKHRAQRFWRRYFSVYDKANESAHYRTMLARHVELLDPQPGERILDAGTGTGNVAQALLERGARVVGIDFLESALEVCRRKCPAGDFRVGDLTGRLAFDDEEFAKLACCNVIYLLKPADQLHALGELHRVLERGGRGVVTVFHRDFSKKQLLLATLAEERRRAGLVGLAAYVARNAVATARILYYISRLQAQRQAGQYTFFTQEELGELLRRAGFEVESIEPTLASQCLLALVRKP
jgi:ubiquinone/menaquinone biosynthesis C-methylase UbiE